MTVHQSALYVGTIVSSLAAGYIGERHGWRATFFIFGFLGLAVAAVPRCSFALRRGATLPGKPYVSMAA
jgi:MFS family permease